MWSTLPEFPSFQLRFAVLGRRPLGSGSRWFFLGFFFTAPLCCLHPPLRIRLHAGMLPCICPDTGEFGFVSNFLPLFLQLRVVFTGNSPNSIACRSALSTMVVFFCFLGLFAVADRVFFLQVPSSICSLEVMVPGCKCKQPIRSGTKMLVLLPVPCNQRMMLRS